MSTTVQQSRLFGQVDVSLSGSQFVSRSSGEQSWGEESLSVRYASVSRKQKHRKPEGNVLRRMKGLLLEISNQEARVAFVQDGKTILYDMPASHFRNAGIEQKNQPFQMDEIEMKTDLGMIVGYRFLPLAKASDAYIETLDFDEERRRKRDLILKKFAKPKG
jgi:hypothetical protein